MQVWWFVGTFINCGIMWNIPFTVKLSSSLRTSACGLTQRAQTFGTSNIVLPPPWFSDRCYCILKVDQTGKQSKVIKHHSGYNLISLIVLSRLRYQDSVVPAWRFLVQPHPPPLKSLNPNWAFIFQSYHPNIWPMAPLKYPQTTVIPSSPWWSPPPHLIYLYSEALAPVH